MATTHEADVKAWQAQRDSGLRSENGWLTLVGLHWLEAGANRVGSAEDAVVRLPASCPGHVATIHVELDGSLPAAEAAAAAKLSLQPASASTVLSIDGKEVTGSTEAIPIKSDAAGATATVLGSGSVNCFVIHRDTKLGVRVKDKQAKSLTEFKGMEYFPISDKFRVRAEYKAFEVPKVLELTNAYGLKEIQRCPGTLHFELDGKELSLMVVDEDGEPDNFWLLFKDQTNGVETYGMRYMYCKRPAAGTNITEIDFNKCYNPPCALTPYATCALPPRENRLAVRIEAGEKTYKGEGAH